MGPRRGARVRFLDVLGLDKKRSPREDVGRLAALGPLSSDERFAQEREVLTDRLWHG